MLVCKLVLCLLKLYSCTQMYCIANYPTNIISGVVQPMKCSCATLLVRSFNIPYRQLLLPTLKGFIVCASMNIYINIHTLYYNNYI